MIAVPCLWYHGRRLWRRTKGIPDPKLTVQSATKNDAEKNRGVQVVGRATPAEAISTSSQAALVPTSMQDQREEVSDIQEVSRNACTWLFEVFAISDLDCSIEHQNVYY